MANCNYKELSCLSLHPCTLHKVEVGKKRAQTKAKTTAAKRKKANSSNPLESSSTASEKSLKPRDFVALRLASTMTKNHNLLN